MKKKLLIGLACLLLVCGCKDVKLTDGKNAIVTFKEGGISSDELFSALKDKYGADVLVNLIDKSLLDKKYEKTTEETNYVNQTMKTLKDAASEAKVDLTTYISAYYGIKDEDELKEYLSLNFKRNKWVEDYAVTTVTDKQVNQYYEKEVYGDIEASQILITIDADSDASDEDKTKAENKAQDTARNIIKELQAGKDFAELAKKYSKDQTSAENGGSLGKVNDGDLADEALEALRNLKDGSYTTSPVKSSYGYHILYRKSQDAKPELNDELTKTIKEKVGKEISEEDGFNTKALKALREENEMKIIDTDLKNKLESGN